MQWRQIIAVTRNLLYATAMNQIVGGLKIYRKQIRKMSLFPVKMFNKLQWHSIRLNTGLREKHLATKAFSNREVLPSLMTLIFQSFTLAPSELLAQLEFWFLHNAGKPNNQADRVTVSTISPFI